VKALPMPIVTEAQDNWHACGERSSLLNSMKDEGRLDRDTFMSLLRHDEESVQATVGLE
jgi:hypothetical protein